jgi:hypothetical protein
MSKPAFITRLLIVIVFSVSANAAFARSDGDSAMVTPFFHADTLRPMLTSMPPVIDGDLTDPVWKLAPRATGFATFVPDYGKIPKEQTDVGLAYDKENIYFAFRCYDDPALIKSSLASRDKLGGDDFVCVNLDAFNDQQGGYALYVNPNGSQADSRFSATNEDFNPDFVWYSAAKIDSLGYTVEIKIPLKSIRYSSSDPTVMGVILERYISRRSEHSSVPHLDPAKGFAILTEMEPIAYPGVDHYTLMELLPAVTAMRQDVRKGTDLVRDDQKSELSLTAKYGISSDLILDGTVNPDFSQVESDAGQVDINLRYSLFYPEKRPFFLEGIDNFAVAANSNAIDPTIYYSRTIADPFLGAKVTGKLGALNTLAALYVADNVLEQDRPSLGRYVQVPVVRYRRTLGNDSYVGGMYAARELENGNNRVAGFDEQYRLSDASVIASNGFLSWAKDGPQSSPVSGHTFGAQYVYGTRDLDYNINVREVSRDFRADMGYITRTGAVNFLAFARPKIYPPELFQRIEFDFMTSHTRDAFSDLWETSNDFAVTAYFAGSWILRTRANYSTEIFGGQRFQTSGIHTQLRTQITKEVFANILYRRVRAIYYNTPPAQGKSYIVSAVLILQPWDDLQGEADFTYSDFYRDADNAKLYDYPITRLKLTYQLNKYLFVRVIGQYNGYYKELATDLLASFTYIPGTVIYLGTGSIYDRVRWNGSDFSDADQLLEMRRGIFLKMSYLWRG